MTSLVVVVMAFFLLKEKMKIRDIVMLLLSFGGVSLVMIG